MKWLAFDIGCIECHVESSVIGVFATKELAEEACSRRDEELGDFYDGGQHHFKVFELGDDD